MTGGRSRLKAGRKSCKFTSLAVLKYNDEKLIGKKSEMFVYCEAKAHFLMHLSP
ncbi:Fasciclin-2, partial [Araneus ventricosus]